MKVNNTEPHVSAQGADNNSHKEPDTIDVVVNTENLPTEGRSPSNKQPQPCAKPKHKTIAPNSKPTPKATNDMIKPPSKANDLPSILEPEMPDEKNHHDHFLEAGRCNSTNRL